MEKERLNHFYESQQLTSDLIYHLFDETERFRVMHEKNELWGKKYLDGKILVTLFYEPSTRTRMSFESAIMRLGGNVLSSENASEFSSAIKKEKMEDTIRVIHKYGDCVVIRHKVEDSAKVAASLSKVPIINGGDGKGQHPTQALLDIYTVHKEIGRLENLNVAMVGDLHNGRTVRSLCYLLGKFKGNKINFVSPENLRMKSDIKHYLQMHNTQFEERDDIEKILPYTDFVYMTRTQSERMSEDEKSIAEKEKHKYLINLDRLVLMKKESRILHPLPKVDEIQLPIEIEEEDPRIAYFRQSENGLYVRMALLSHLLK